MLDVKIFDNNPNSTIKNISKEKIQPIVVSNINGYNANELLCAALGACTGREVMMWCKDLKKQVNIFNHIYIDMKDNRLIVILDLNTKIKTKDGDYLTAAIQQCPIAQLIKDRITVEFKYNKTEKVESIENCCGG